jgi:hypothetical protein
MMNGAHIHLLVNEVPILAFAFATLFFLMALKDSGRVAWTLPGMVMLGIASLGAFVAYMTGDPAVDTIKGIPHTSNHALSEHHVRATIAVTIAGMSAVIGIVAMYLFTKSGTYSRRVVLVLVIASLASTATLGWTGLAGGRIGHTELQLPGDKAGGPVHEHEHEH